MFDFGILVFTTFKLQQRKNPGKKIVPQTHKKTKTLSKSRNPQNQKTRKEIKIVFSRSSRGCQNVSNVNIILLILNS